MEWEVEMKRKIFFTAILVISIIILTFANQTSKESALQKNDQEIKSLITKMINYEPEEFVASGSPYPYINNNPHFDELKNYGFEAVFQLHDYLYNSEIHGLKEYIAAIAMERLAGVDLKTSRYSYASPEDFRVAYFDFAYNVEKSLNRILESNKDKEWVETEIEALGVFILPYLHLSIAEGNTEFEEVYSRMISKLKTSNYENDKDLIEEVESYMHRASQTRLNVLVNQIIERAEKKGTEISNDSNAWIERNYFYESIVKLGVKIIPMLESEIAESKESISRAVILSKALEDIKKQ